MYLKRNIVLGLSGIGVILLVGVITTQSARSEDVSSSKAVEALFPEKNDSDRKAGIEDLTKDFSKMEKSLKSSEARLAQIEERLGPSNRLPTLATSFERRLEDIEKRLSSIERQIAKLQNLEKRVRKLERKN